MPPISVMMMEMTAAKIGRSMKKCEKFIARRCTWRLAGVASIVPSSGVTLLPRAAPATARR